MNKIIDIPSPIDLKDPLHATQWAKEANLKRPYRIESSNTIFLKF